MTRSTLNPHNSSHGKLCWLMTCCSDCPNRNAWNFGVDEDQDVLHLKDRDAPQEANVDLAQVRARTVHVHRAEHVHARRKPSERARVHWLLK